MWFFTTGGLVLVAQTNGPSTVAVATSSPLPASAPVPMEEIRFGGETPKPTATPSVPVRTADAPASEELRVAGSSDSRGRLAIPEVQPEPILATLSQVFVDRFGLAVPLGDVVLLVILTNIFALFRSPRMILLMSYLFSLKWVILSNYQDVAHYSMSMAHLTTWILGICGLFTLVLFCLDWFNKP